MLREAWMAQWTISKEALGSDGDNSNETISIKYHSSYIYTFAIHLLACKYSLYKNCK